VLKIRQSAAAREGIKARGIQGSELVENRVEHPLFRMLESVSPVVEKVAQHAGAVVARASK
jgi:hypothetical protein